MASSLHKLLVLHIGCRRIVASPGTLRSFSIPRSSLPDGFRSPQAVIDAVATALAGETQRSKDLTPADSSSTSKPQHRQLEGDVITSKEITAQQLLHPKQTLDWQLIKPEHFKNVPMPKNWMAGLEQLQKRIGVQFQDVTLLQSALTHHGCLPENAVPEDVPVMRLSNRSLEFLGDSLLGVAAAGYVYQMLPIHEEGQLSRAKSSLVNNETLAEISTDLGIPDLVLSPIKFSKKKGSRLVMKGRDTIAAGALESIIAAIYLDQDMEAAMDFVATHVFPRAVEIATRDVIWEPIVELQILLQHHYYGQPIYKYLPNSKKAAEKTVELYVKGRPILKASGGSYKQARGRAAEAAYWHFEKMLSSVKSGQKSR